MSEDLELRRRGFRNTQEVKCVNIQVYAKVNKGQTLKEGFENSIS